MHEISVDESARNAPDSHIRKHITKTNPWNNRRHLLDTRDLSRPEIEAVIELAIDCKRVYGLGTPPLSILANKTVATVFYENSTRTRSSFELAAKKLGATVLNLDIASSSVSKGETIVDTTSTLISMGINALVQRHSSSGSAHQVATVFNDRVQVVNAGDGWNAHPTQALLDLLTMREIKSDLTGAKVAIVGDITHSRVARSNIWLLNTLGVDVHVVGPPTLIPAQLQQLGVTVHTHLEPALEQSDFIMALRLQLERQKSGLIPSVSEYRKLYRLDHRRLRLAKPGVRILHPGPVNRGIEITDELASDPAISLIETQVTNGIAVRMAVLTLLLAGAGGIEG